ncbi:uncharacterized protein Nmag_2723 [Natrialba magadii ATCC 43099]|uniref:Uncharacterized protein n=1 Tax=Natrialba magadii (strain ATCC 43099 / DSM 3394 / CCM 3739 / CIP 104546 / IAM 13178 / JCM 8861 / NBRC 102185 / NCIMB 2190 / MS3) TaxID=547559 RepID=D3SZL9_NATMM|nr:uncharacterized protein Nmag_2723 [Natrialba magadii ATCC 43099]
MSAFITEAKPSTVTSSDDGGYVHDPSAFDGDGTASAENNAGDSADETGADWTENPRNPAAVDREFDWRGWVLVGVIIIAFIVAPISILLWPPTLNYFVALLILPLFPAALLAITAVWATTRP